MGRRRRSTERRRRGKEEDKTGRRGERRKGLNENDVWSGLKRASSPIFIISHQYTRRKA